MRAAVDFWNHTFSEIGLPFRLGAVLVVRGKIPLGDLQLLHQTIVDYGFGAVSLPASVAAEPGDLIVALRGGIISIVAIGIYISIKLIIGTIRNPASPVNNRPYRIQSFTTGMPQLAVLQGNR